MQSLRGSSSAGGSVNRTVENDDAAEPTPSRTRRLRWWISGITFVGGVVVGMLAVGLLSASNPSFGAAGPDPNGPTANSAATPGGSIPVVAQAQVNAACLSVINEAQDLAAILTGLDDAVTDVDLQHLDDIVRQIQPIQPRLSRDLQDCEIDAELVNPSGTPATPSPSPVPTPSPTR
jgi:hypothetical protein